MLSEISGDVGWRGRQGTYHVLEEDGGLDDVGEVRSGGLDDGGEVLERLGLFQGTSAVLCCIHIAAAGAAGRQRPDAATPKCRRARRARAVLRDGPEGRTYGLGLDTALDDLHADWVQRDASRQEDERVRLGRLAVWPLSAPAPVLHGDGRATSPLERERAEDVQGPMALGALEVAMVV